MSEQPRLFDRAFGWTTIDLDDRLGRFTDYLQDQGVELDDEDLDGALVVVEPDDGRREK